jgi:hypothetical protein
MKVLGEERKNRTAPFTSHLAVEEKKKRKKPFTSYLAVEAKKNGRGLLAG